MHTFAVQLFELEHVAALGAVVDANVDAFDTGHAMKLTVRWVPAVSTLLNILFY